MTTWKLAPALAAGCAIVLKPDPQTPLTALRARRARGRGRLPAGRRQRRSRRRPDDGLLPRAAPGRRQGRVHRLDEDGRRDHAALLRPDQAPDARARRQEPEHVFADADLDDAIPSAVWSIYYSAGQSCEARSRLLVEESIYDDVVAQLADKAGAIKVGDPLDPETQMGSLISAGHRDRVHGFVERGRRGGRRGGDRRRARDGKGAFYTPTVLAKVDNRWKSRRRRSSARS